MYSHSDGEIRVQWRGIRTALALDLDEDGEISRLLAIKWFEGLEELETVRLGINGNRDAGTVLRRALVGVFTGVVTTGWEFVTRWVSKLEGLAVGADESVSDGVESEVTSKGHSSHDIGRGDESMSSGVGIIAAGEVAVVRSDD